MIRLLAIGDGSVMTGFGRVMKGVLDYLQETGQYDISLRAINYMPGHHEPYTYEVLPITKDHGNDPLGFHHIEEHVAEAKPDIIFLLHDLWNLTTYLARLGDDLPTVVYFPVDCPNLKWNHALGLGAVSEAVCYTRFGAREAAASVRDAVDVICESARQQPNAGVRTDAKATSFVLPKDGGELRCRFDRLARWQNIEGWNVIPHALDHERFEQRPKDLCRRAFGLPEDAFIVGYVGTNQFRKRQDLALRIFAELRKTHDAHLVFHCAGGDRAGWDLGQLARSLGVHSWVHPIHHEYPHLNDNDLVTLYNCLDAHMNTSGGEGWGLTSFESAACGVPQLVPDWSATRELWEHAAALLPISGWRHEPKFLNTAHCEVDVAGSAGQLRMLADSDVLRQAASEAALGKAQQQPHWSQVGAAFHTLVQRAVREPLPVSMSFDEVVLERRGEVKRELYGVTTIEQYEAQRRGNG